MGVLFGVSILCQLFMFFLTAYGVAGFCWLCCVFVGVFAWLIVLLFFGSVVGWVCFLQVFVLVKLVFFGAWLLSGFLWRV